VISPGLINRKDSRDNATPICIRKNFRNAHKVPLLGLFTVPTGSHNRNSGNEIRAQSAAVLALPNGWLLGQVAGSSNSEAAAQSKPVERLGRRATGLPRSRSVMSAEPPAIELRRCWRFLFNGPTKNEARGAHLQRYDSTCAYASLAECACAAAVAGLQ
jgi:hypothetical protein